MFLSKIPCKYGIDTLSYNRFSRYIPQSNMTIETLPILQDADIYSWPSCEEKIKALQKRPREMNLLASLEQTYTVIQETCWRVISELIDGIVGLIPGTKVFGLWHR